MTTAGRRLDEMCHLTAQSLTSLETSDHFQVIKPLGEGSYGHVMLAVHKKRGTPMALKFFPRGSTSLLLFLREYHLSLSFCTHPSLTAALGIAFSTPSHYVFAQQPSLYGDLYDIIVPEVGLEEGCVQRVASQLSGALSHLHALGFVHRDVKPENVFLCDAACRWVKLGDFGLSRATGTRIPTVWYSSAYCTPESEVAKEPEETGGVDENGNERAERRRVLEPVEPSEDSWCLGILVYVMLTGAMPWHETASDNRSYRAYRDWFDRESAGTSRGEEEDEERGMRGCHPVAPQFRAFTPLACALFRALLHPQPRLRSRPSDVPGFLGGAWLLDSDITG